MNYLFGLQKNDTPTQPEDVTNVVIFHFPCNDGFTSALLVREAMPKGTCYFIPSTYSDDLWTKEEFDEPWEFFRGTRVWVVDYSLPRKVLLKLSGLADKITVLDHHESRMRDYLKEEWEEDFAPVALERLADYLDAEPKYNDPKATFPLHSVCMPNVGYRLHTGMCGAQLTFEYLRDQLCATMPMQGRDTYVQAMEKFVTLVGDRDLWLWRQRNSKELNAYLAAQPYEFQVWTTLLRRLYAHLPTEKAAVEAGRTLLQYQAKQNQEAADRAVLRDITFGSAIFVDVPVANATNSASEVCDLLRGMYPEAPFVMVYQDLGDQRVFSLRNGAAKAVDVSELAKTQGGGGHPNAAGFTVPAGPGVDPWGWM